MAEEELRTFSELDFPIFNAGQFNTSTSVAGMTSRGSADIHLGKKEMIILGTGICAYPLDRLYNT